MKKIRILSVRFCCVWGINYWLFCILNV